MPVGMCVGAFLFFPANFKLLTDFFFHADQYGEEQDEKTQ